MGESKVLHRAGDVQRGAGWGMVPSVAALVAGAWAVDRYTGQWLGGWRYIPMVLLGFYAVMTGVIAVLLFATEASLKLTDGHLVVRRPWLRRRWAWGGLRGVQVVEADTQDGTVGVLVLVPVRGSAVVLPGPYREDLEGAGGQSGELDRLAGELSAALRTHRPEAEPFDDGLRRAVVQQAQESLRAEGRRREWRGRWLWTPALVVLLAGVFVRSGFQLAGNPGSGRTWEQTTAIALGPFAVLLVLVSAKYRERIPGRWWTYLVLVLWAVWAGLSLKGG